jgi:hypothetical protein
LGVGRRPCRNGGRRTRADRRRSGRCPSGPLPSGGGPRMRRLVHNQPRWRIFCHAAVRLFRPDLRLLGHADRLGERHRRRARAVARGTGARARPRAHPAGVLRGRGAATACNPDMLYRDLLAEVHGAIAEGFGLARMRRRRALSARRSQTGLPSPTRRPRSPTSRSTSTS